MANLWKIHLQVKDEGYVQNLALGLFRSDYMVHTPENGTRASLQQVEFNTISSSFGGLAEKVARLHTDLASFPSHSASIAYPPHILFNTHTRSESSSSSKISSGLPEPNNAVEVLASGLLSAHEAYGQSQSIPALPLCIIFLVQDGERNIFDQLAISSHIHHARPDVPTFRLPISQILTRTSIPSHNENPARPLIYTAPNASRFEVSLVYFRALYAPSEYNTSTSWAARHHLERSAAIKCPSILLQLAGSKKVQQVLTDAGTLEHFLPHSPASTLAKLRHSFAPQYSMSLGPDSEGVKIALDPARARNHVLKPQREGGGNNIYRDAIPQFLAKLDQEQYKQYILMELIRPPPDAKNTALRSDGEVVSGKVISELGIFGTCLWKGGAGKDAEIMRNDEGGYLLRTKARDSDEGGVAAGFSSLDSVILFDEDNRKQNGTV